MGVGLMGSLAVSPSSAKEIALGVGGRRSVSLQAQGVESAHVRWSISSDGAAEAAKLDRDQGALDEAVSLTGAAPGKATLTARVQVDVDGAPLALSASARVYVSGEGQVVLPDEYDIPAAAAPVDEYVVQNDGAVGGVYLIYGDKASSGGRILYLHTGATTTACVRMSPTGASRPRPAGVRVAAAGHRTGTDGGESERRGDERR